MVSVLNTQIKSTQRIQPSQANNHEDTHGGEVVKMMDELAAISAMKVANETCVTANISSVDFKNPIPVGHVAELSAYVYDTGVTSLDVRVNVKSHDPRESTFQPTTSACFVMVAINENGDPLNVPDVTTETEEGKDLVAAAPC